MENMEQKRDDRATSPTVLGAAVRRQRLCPDLECVLADDRLVEAVRSGCITDASPVHPVFRLLARWRRQVLTVR
ncbi:MAG: hypothetical protein QOF00_3362 [Pseudonocardiales bacterium]|jgi:hypothetical protein|nr:hypothetical protein [Pseudonocardiales bacterium]